MGDSGSDPFASTFSISSTGAGGNASRAPNWVFTAEQLAESVSVAEGNSHLAEAAARLSACGFMEKVAMRMRNIPPETLPVAKVYLLRFCQRQIVARTNGAVHPYVAGATALFLACKSTDNYRKLPTFIKQCRWVAFKGPEGVKDEFVERPQFKDDDKEYVNWYENIITTEENMTVALCFDLVVDLPHEIVVELLKLCWNGSALESSVDYASFSQQIYQKLKHHASFFANECMSTTLPLRFNRNLQALIILRVAWEATKKGFPISSTPPKVLEFLNSGNPLVAPGNPGLNLFHAPDLFRIIGNFRGANISYDGIYSGIAALEEEPLKGEALSNRLFELGKEILLVSNRPKYEKFIQNWLRPISGALKEKRALARISKSGSASPALGSHIRQPIPAKQPSASFHKNSPADPPRISTQTSHSPPLVPPSSSTTEVSPPLARQSQPHAIPPENASLSVPSTQRYRPYPPPQPHTIPNNRNAQLAGRSIPPPSQQLHNSTRGPVEPSKQPLQQHPTSLSPRQPQPQPQQQMYVNVSSDIMSGLAVPTILPQTPPLPNEPPPPVPPPPPHPHIL
ncbi:hypothetical protein BJ741DRAFT_590597 [Chytriomyces cf. hyalinus JEL632]|nr:hypothetical protein BJ741DRAFT_590597 [Chytriomyces cf. hyalinus JEL632]